MLSRHKQAQIHPYVWILRFITIAIVGLFLLAVAIGLLMPIADGALWAIPLLASFGYCTYIVLRDDRRRRGW
jgi:hypothetical protein